MNRLKYLSLILFSWHYLNSTCFAKEILKVAAIDWCPQICPHDKKNPGYLVEMVQEIFKKTPYELKITYAPWSRSIYNVRQGKADALLSPSKEEAPDLRYHDTPLAHQTHCFWKLNKSDWEFNQVEDLLSTRFVIYRDHSYRDIFKTYFSQNKAKNHIELSYDENYLDRSISLLKKSRAETFLFTANSVIYHQLQQNKKDLKLGKCIKRDELWFALTQKNQKKIDNIIRLLNTQIPIYKNSSRYKKLLKKYNILYPKLFTEK